MSVPYTLIINGHSYAYQVKRYTYQTDRVPVDTERITTMDGVDHVVVIRHKGVLRFEVNPQTEANYKTLCDDLSAGVMTVKYHCLQTNSDVTQTMKVSTLSGALGIVNADRKLVDGISLVFEEL